MSKHDGVAIIPLEAFIKSTGIMPSALAARAGISRQHVLRLRKGTAEPTREIMVRLAAAASAIMRRPVFVAEMFDLGESETLLYGLWIAARAIVDPAPDPG